MRINTVEARNRETLDQIEKVGLTDFADLQGYRKQYPYHGFIDIPLPGGEQISLFCNNDDLTALAYLWIDGFQEEPYSLDLWMKLCRKASTILDIGSHVGLFALAAARANPQARIRAFEAVDFIYARLMVNIQANGMNGIIKGQNVGVSDRSGWSVINLNLGPQMMSKGASLKDKKLPDRKPRKKWLQTEMIDTLCAKEKVDLIKIDVEGHEALALTGAAQTLAATKPTVLCEILRRDVGRGEVFAIFEDLGYECHLILEDEQKTVPTSGADEANVARSAGDRNFLFVHPDRKAGLSDILTV